MPAEPIRTSVIIQAFKTLVLVKKTFPPKVEAAVTTTLPVRGQYTPRKQ